MGRRTTGRVRWSPALWLRPEEREEIEMAAREAGVSTAAYVVRAALDRARRRTAAE